MGRTESIAAGVWARVTRVKEVNAEDTSTSLIRCLGLRRLTFVGVGKTVGVGIYVLIGEATKEAGPSVIVAFLIGFLVTLLNGLCFAEYAAKNPKTGAQYTYMYETVGEGLAFLVGWTSIIGTTAALSLASRGWSGYVDSLFEHSIRNYTLEHIGNWTGSSPRPDYPDIPAISIIILIMILASVGVNMSTTINLLLTIVSGSMLIFISIIGFVYADLDNWTKHEGGFFANGLNGVLKASTACFYAFQGYEVLGYSAEETINPKKNVPRSIVISLVIVTFLYINVAFSFTLMIPYTAIDTSAPFPAAFSYHHVTWAKYIVEIGPILALTNLCILELYTVQRLTYSMATDGLLFKFLGRVSSTTKVPIGPVIIFGPITIILVLTIDLSNLIGFMVLYTFVQYSIFAAYLIILRYKVTDDSEAKLCKVPLRSKSDIVNCMLVLLSSVKFLVLTMYLCLFALSIFIVKRGNNLVQGHSGDIIPVVALGSAVFTILILLRRKEQPAADINAFQVPLMPFLPAASMFFNLLMLVSAVDMGSLIASTSLASIGIVVYLLTVVCDVIRNPDKRDGDDQTKAKLLSTIDEEDAEDLL
ncbi:CTR4-like protein [Mya arenaria]|uniref:CTR4-like protein n=1 Tax=Mya arenaria TaxID=6604 RepID=A0ABY7F0L0_MYAAR|nr:cationic amino acid transporter 4-like [Mya arenaria]XP_052821208.1 cationic amino acid transporter 4-like [Mya arenaria]XP_052821209.1 cationic amino acid transporter 4-like [Mya arenaria]XP_052821211.1 cationic amino acid transporter 4-like [Mya arenaria]WAR14288.1 CTR4-like protein [Mya arenaria]